MMGIKLVIYYKEGGTTLVDVTNEYTYTEFCKAFLQDKEVSKISFYKEKNYEEPSVQ